MTRGKHIKDILFGHRTVLITVLCLFGLYAAFAFSAPRKKHKRKVDDRIYLVHSDVLKYDMYGPNPDAQIVKGHVVFRHQGARLSCDSAYFYQDANSMKAFGHVHFIQGDTLSLVCDRAFYDGQQQQMEARHNVVLKHRRQTLYTDSLNYDRLYGYAYFFEGGRLIDGKDRLVSDWGEYHLDNRQAVFYYNVSMRSSNRTINTDTLHYDTRSSIAHVTGPSKILSKGSVVNTNNGYFNTKTEKVRLYGRSTIVDKKKTITGDSLFYNSRTGAADGNGNVVYLDKENKNSLTCELLRYNEKTGKGFATRKALVRDYSQGDTLYMHADTFKIYTYNINTDSVYRKVHGYPHARAYRKDVQAMSDSLVFNSKDSCLTMYRDPIVWNTNRQLLGEVIKVYTNDSTIRKAEVIGQALSIEKVDDKDHYNQISSSEMDAFFLKGAIHRTVAIGNVKTIYYPVNDKDSSLTGLNYLETDTMRMYLNSERKLDKIWTSKFSSTMYPMTQIPPNQYRLSEFAWFENLRPKDKNDIFAWRGKGEGNSLKAIKRHDAPLQTFGGGVAKVSEKKPDKIEPQSKQVDTKVNNKINKLKKKK
jgi:lipopolysaccharide export system protein LptA